MHNERDGRRVFGGIMMQWIDVCAGVAAMRHASGSRADRSIDRLDFLSPVTLARSSCCRRRSTTRRARRWRSAAASTPRTCRTQTQRYVTKAYLTVRPPSRSRQAARDSRSSRLATEDDQRRTTKPRSVARRVSKQPGGHEHGFIDSKQLGRLRVSGSDRVRFLQGLTTVNVEQLADGCTRVGRDPVAEGPACSR